jgi:hypothetical protein
VREPYTRPGTTYVTEHKIDMAALLPMAAAFRELLVLRGDRYTWRVDPYEAFPRCANQLWEILVARSRKVKQSTQLAADMEYWSQCVPVVMRAMTDLAEARA